MKRLYTFAAVAAILTLASCNREPEIVIQNTPAVDVTNQKLDPNANESGTVRAYAGTQVTAKGLNLDRVGSVKVDGVDATIVSKEMKTLVFEIPVLNKPQQDDPYMVDLEVFEEGTDKRIFKYDYYVTVPVTDAIVTGFTPAEGTVGEEVTIAGRNLEQITSVSFGGVSVAADAFVSSASAAVVVAVPAVAVTEADTQLDVSAVWAGGTIALDGKFTLHVPVFTSYSQAAPALLGDDIVLPGANLDLVKAIKWGDTALLISEQSATAITIKVPTGLELQNPAVVSKALTAVYGVKEDQVITIAASFQVDTTPVGPAAPVFTSASPAEAAYTAMFLGREVVVKGQNMASVEKFKVDGIEAALSAEATDIEARFIMPKTITGTAAREVDLIAVWNGGNELDCGKITVYPFYYTKGLRIGLGSNSKTTYPAYNSENAFILLDEGRVVSADYWNDLPVDEPAKTSPLVTTANKVTAADGNEEKYYAVQPYMFATASSAHKLAFQNPSNSSSQLKTHRLSDLSTSLPSNFGTPLIFMKIMGDGDTKTNVAAGTLTDILSNTSIAGTSAPAFGKTEGDTWVKGSVICLQYLTYEHATTGGKAGDISDVYKTGYMYIRDITCGDPATGLALESREGYIEIDLYWSNVL